MGVGSWRCGQGRRYIRRSLELVKDREWTKREEKRTRQGVGGEG